jgi:hypothetical protein
MLNSNAFEARIRARVRQPEEKLWHRLIVLLIGSPGRLMISAWAIISLLYFIGPIIYDRPPSLSTWGSIVGCILIFVLGARERKTRSSHVPSAGPTVSAETSGRRINRMVRATGLIGLIGILCIVVDKVFLSGLDYSQGITALRYERLAQASLGDEKLNRSLLLYVGSLIVCFTCVAYLLYILKAEVLTRSSIWLAQFGLVSPAVLAVLSGGRSPIVLALLLALGGVMVRTLNNQTPLPKEPVGRRLLLGFILLALFYNAYVFAERRLAMGVTDYNAFSEHFVNNSEAKPTAFARAVVDGDYVSPDLLMSLINSDYYLTHSLSNLDKIVLYEAQIGPYYGEYQFSLVATVLERIFPSLSLNADITRDSLATGTYGSFPTAWAGMYLDFGWFGAVIAIFLCGWISGRVYRRALKRQDVGAQLIMCYVIGGILLSPLISPFSASISLPTLASILICAGLLNFQPRTLRRSEGQNTKHRLVLQSTVR